MNEYKYILTYKTTVETLTVNPAGWDKLGITLMRHEVYKSVLRTFSLSLRFANKVGGGYSLIKQAYETEGIYAEIAIEIKKRNPNTNDYDAFYTGILDFTPGKFTFDRDLFVEISIIDSSILQKFISRDENEIDVYSDKTIDDISITKITPTLIQLTPVDIVVKANLTYDFTDAYRSTNEAYYWNPTYQRKETENILMQVDSPGMGLFYENTNTNTLIVKLKWIRTFEIKVQAAPPYTSTPYVNFEWRFDTYKANNDLKSRETISFPTTFTHVESGGIHYYTFTGINILYELEKELLAGEYVEFYIKDFHPEYINYTSRDENGSFEIIEITKGFNTTSCEALKVFDCVNKSLEILTNESNSLYSDIMYSGQLANDFVFNGFQIRKYPNPKVNFKFKDLFKSFYAVANIGLWFDLTQNKFIVENNSYFYNNNKIFSFGEVSKFKEQAFNSGYYSIISSGFDNKGSYEKVQGALEFAVKREYSTAAKVKETKELLSPYRFDSVGIEDLRIKQYIEKASEDVDGDNDIFIVRTEFIEGEEGGYYPIMPSIGSPLYLGMDVFYSYYNTMLTPRQNTLRHGNIISSNSWKSTIPYKAQKTEKQFDLAVDGIDENSDIQISELAASIFIPRLYTFQYYLTDEQIQDILADPHGYGEFLYNGKLYSGYINKVELNSDYGGLANFELIARDEEVIYRTFEDGSMHVFTDDSQKING